MAWSLYEQFSLHDTCAIVTGGAKGLGNAMACALRGAGSSVSVIDIEALSETSLEDEGVFFIRANLADREERREAFHLAIGQLGSIDILVNSAGIQRRSEAVAFKGSDWDDVIELNLTAVFELSQMAAKIMIPKGRGKIINVASMLSFSGGIRVPAYAASKGGVAQLTKALSNEWANKGVNVNAIAPGFMLTGLNEALIKDTNRYEAILNRIPAGRWGDPEDLKGIVVFLASRASDYVNGAILPVDGGFLGR